MPTITGSPYAVVDVLGTMGDAVIIDSSSTTVTFALGDERIRLGGSGFVVEDQGGELSLTAGTIATIDVTLEFDFGNPPVPVVLNLYSVDDLALAATDLETALDAERSDADAAALETLFGSLGFTVQGSSGSETLVPYVNADGVLLTLTAANVWNMGDGDDSVVGGTAVDRIFGEGGNDTLDGAGGRDILAGGIGDDTYVVSGRDVIQEAANEGLDTVLASVSSTLRAEVENLTLTGAANLSGLGNGLANVITGNGGINLLDGRGGADTLLGGDGADQLVDADGGDVLDGGAGNDAYILSALGTTVAETQDQASGGGVDLVRSRVSTTLGANIENLGLLGTSALDGTGNGLANVMTGTNGLTTLTGLAGADRLLGNGGDDLLDGGDDADALFGGTGRDRLLGGAQADRLDGGIAGDTLTGGTGADQFLFLDAFGVDQVTDFEDGIDRLNLRDLREENGGAALTFDQLLITQAGTTVRVQIDLDRNGVADVIDLDGNGLADNARIELLNLSAASLTGADFVL